MRKFLSKALHVLMTIVLIAVEVAAVVFAPYYAGKYSFIINTSEYDVVRTYLAGWLTIVLGVIALVIALVVAVVVLVLVISAIWWLLSRYFKANWRLAQRVHARFSKGQSE